MKTLTLKNKFQTNVTLITNDFIDYYMVKANGEFVKVYLFLLRHLDNSCSSLTVSMIADRLNNTEGDVLRAFRYWEAEGLLALERDGDGKLTGIELERAPSIFPSRGLTSRTVSAPKSEGTSVKVSMAESESEPVKVSMAKSESEPVSAAPISTFSQVKTGTKQRMIHLDSAKARKELKSLFFIAEQYLGKTLSKTDADAITYFYETLGMSADLIDYLLASCVENGHKSMHYIQKVAISWADEGITSVVQAQQRSLIYNKNCYTVLNSFGIKNRGPIKKDITYIQKWTDEFGFSLDIIQEACARTISAIHEPSFEYADSILENWHKHQVRHLKDIEALDTAFQKEKSTRKTPDHKQRTAAKNLNNFERRSYDMDSLEEQLLNSN